MNEYGITKHEYDKNAQYYYGSHALTDWSELVQQFIPYLTGKKLLDAGCGTGHNIGRFLAKGFEVDGLDFSAESIAIAKSRFPRARFFEADLLNTHLPSNSYDGIFACASLLHIKKADVPRALLEFKRLLKQNGKLFISVKEGKGERIIQKKDRKRFFNFFQTDELKKMIEAGGFQILRLELVHHDQLTGKDPEEPNWIWAIAERL